MIAGNLRADRVKGKLGEIGIRRYGAAPAGHAHAHRQLVLPLSGSLEMEVGGRGGVVAGQQAAAVAGGVRHSFQAAGENAFLVVDLPDDGAAPRFWEAAERRPFVSFGTALAGHVGFLAGLFSAAPATGLRAAMAGGMIVEGLARDTGLAGSPLPAPVARAVRLIEACAATPLTVPELARAVGLSPGRLHSRFREATGLSPMRYLALERFHRAAFLLETTAAPVSRVAQDVGYADQSAFTRAFRRHAGCAPQDYRDRARGR